MVEGFAERRKQTWVVFMAVQMTKATPSQWIAERTFIRRDTNKQVVVRIGCPEPYPESPHGDWRCPFEIRGLDEDMSDFGFGIDTVGALQNALLGIRLLLSRSKVPLMWELTKTNDIGFPMAVPTGYGVAFERRIEKMIKAEEQALFKAAEERAAQREAQRKARRKTSKKP